jgi:hypothetical protein
MSIGDWVGSLIGFTLTLMVFSYLIGDNPLFRITMHIFIGVAAAFAVVIAIENVIFPRLIEPFFNDNTGGLLLAVVPLILAGLLLFKISPRFAFVGSLPTAFLVGISAAAAIGGAVTGTLIPQVFASVNLLDLGANQAFDTSQGLGVFNGVIILIGTVATMAYFQFSRISPTSERSQIQNWIDGIGQIGQVFIAITFGFLFAGIFSAALTALIGRAVFLIDFIRQVFLLSIP